MNSKDKTVRGEAAKRLLNDSLFVEALTTIRTNLYKEFNNTKVDEDKAREKIYLMNHALNELERHIQSVLRTGEFEAKRLELEKEGKK